MHGLDRRSRARGPGRAATTEAGQGAPHRPGRRSPWLALVLLAFAQLMLVLDVTVVNVALPDIGTALHLNRGEVPWVMTAYTLVFGGLMLLGGRFADLFGARLQIEYGLLTDPRITACDGFTPREARKNDELATLRAALADKTRECTELAHRLDAAATAIAALHHDNTLLRQELDHRGQLVGLSS